ncbi:C45 family autoproteolytic acyltransferase/hydolase [Pontitalea aquivivens]|uniref:C45 family autoproteolytic acyltransferase/hydolase n=1 Tax=Pontitalea aquivivens TaxID=3388663 RepID=UPI0039710BC3
MSNKKNDLGWHTAGGSPRDIGRALGQAGRAAVNRHLLPAPIWQLVTAPAHAGRVARMAGAVQQRFPAIWAEIEGLAEGLGLPVTDVFAWNCRGDLLASTPDGCTTVLLPGGVPVLGHNEDGLPFFRGHAFIADIRPDGAPGFRAFCYPGSIPGHTFAFTDAGLVQTVNNLRLTGVEPGLPRMVLGRAVLGAETLDMAITILRDRPDSGGFHFALSHQRDRRILSVEYGASEISVREITAPAVHANHALHHVYGLGHQIITQSSGDRQRRGNALIAAGVTDPLSILRDEDGPGLPIRRDAADDPDDENTLATAILRVEKMGIDWRIHDRRSGDATYTGITPR